ncbi:MAG: NADP-dependent phosphogluconate dehydrogenase [Deltaproteobacteria bacterium]|nr:NADP-dependent phosphogluconate dehydrogenase [Deltaproteobacteria bacterium]
MSEAQQELGIVGLGRMGGGLALQALERGMRVIGFTIGGAREELVRGGLTEASSLAALASSLAPPRVLLLYIPAGPAVDQVADELAAILEPGDVVVDGGNSYWGDSIRRADRLSGRGIHFVDAGTSGGVDGARHGACFMLGGEPSALARVEPLLRPLAVPGGYVHAGPSGAGHYTKLVHNGIEFGMLQAIGEGVALLEAFPHELPVADVLRCWRHGSVIRSWLVDLLEQAYRARGGVDDVPSHVDDTGEVNWLVGDALRFEVPIPVIAQAVMQLLSSRDGRKSWARAIALMRHGFGGHPFGQAPAIAEERRVGRVGPPG